MPTGLHSETLFRSPSVEIVDVRCRPTESACGREEWSDAHSIAIPRRGVFVKHACGEETIGDVNGALFFNKHEPYRVSHPLAGGDDCMSFHFSPEMLEEALRVYDRTGHCDADQPFAHSHAPLSAKTVFECHRLRAAAERDGGPLEVEASAARLLDRVFSEAYAARGQRPSRIRPGTERVHREWVERARMVLHQRMTERVLLNDVAREVHCSAFHLVRIFRQRLGVPIHRYHTRLRLRTALDQLTQGRTDLTKLALDLGFASHAHFTDAFRREFGLPPSRV